MIRNVFRDGLFNARKQGRRLVVPLVGFPGLNITNCTIKLAQQNYREHFKVMKAIKEGKSELYSCGKRKQ